MKLSAFDGGFHTSQTYNQNGNGLLLSQGGLSSKSGFNLFASNGTEVTIDNETWMFDPNQSTLSTRTLDDNWVFSTMYRALLFGTLCQTIAPSTHDLTIEKLWTGLPYLNHDDSRFREEFKGSLTGSFSFHCGIKRTVTIENVFCVPQNFGPVFYHLLDDNGNLKMKNRESFIIGSVNVGGNTTELATTVVNIINGKPKLNIVHSQCKTEYTGMFSILSSIRDALSKKFPSEQWRDEELFTALRTNQVTLDNIDYDVSLVINPIKTAFQNRIAASVNNNWSKQAEYSLSRVNYLVSSGGGAYTVAPKLRGLRKDLLISDKPQWDTVVGYHKLGRNQS